MCSSKTSFFTRFLLLCLAKLICNTCFIKHTTTSPSQCKIGIVHLFLIHIIDQPLCNCLHLYFGPVITHHTKLNQDIGIVRGVDLWPDCNRILDSIEARIMNAVLLETNTSLILLSCSYIVSASLQSFHETKLCPEKYQHAVHTRCCAMMRTAQQQAVA
jgi:hypothetical protein